MLTDDQKSQIRKLYCYRIRKTKDTELVNWFLAQTRMTDMTKPADVYFLKLLKLELLKRVKGQL